jgi:hypothetical protein
LRGTRYSCAAGTVPRLRAAISRIGRHHTLRCAAPTRTFHGHAIRVWFDPARTQAARACCQGDLQHPWLWRHTRSLAVDAALAARHVTNCEIDIEERPSSSPVARQTSLSPVTRPSRRRRPAGRRDPPSPKHTIEFRRKRKVLGCRIPPPSCTLVLRRIPLHSFSRHFRKELAASTERRPNRLSRHEKL